MCGILFLQNQKEEMKNELKSIGHRGPDNSKVKITKKGNMFGFNRLSIHNMNENGNQPFEKNDITLICNGEIYNYLDLAKYCSDEDYSNKSDCEIILDIYKEKGIEVCNYLDGDFAFVLEDDKGDIFAARDPIGVRPLFFGYKNESNEIVFASEIKAIKDLCKSVEVFPPGHYYYKSKFEQYINLNVPFEKAINGYSRDTLKYMLMSSVEKRLTSERPIGFFLSGGLDSSLIASLGKIALNKQITTFSIGINDSPDLKYARKVAKFLDSNHHEVKFTTTEALNALEEVIYHLESYDCTTIRASVPMYLLSKYVKENTNIKVLLSGEGADELFGGYLYFHKAPTLKEFHEETQRLLENVHNYDVLRADRCTSAHGLELRVPFFDKCFIKYVSEIDPLFKKTKMEKQILRDSFMKYYLPEEVLNRQKNGMSDAVGYEWVDFIRDFAEKQYTEKYSWNPAKYVVNTPTSKEEYYYREIYNKLFPKNNFIKHIWRPKYTNILDPSAKLLPEFKKV